MARVKQSNSMTVNKKKSSVANIFDEFLRARKNSIAPATLTLYKNLGDSLLIPELVRLTDDDLSSVTANDIRTIIDDYSTTHNAGGVAFIRRHFQCFINWYWKEYELDRVRTNPFSKVEKSKKPKTPPIPGIDRNQVTALLDTAKKRSTFPERDVAIIMVLCDTGIRRASLLNLKMGDIDLDHSQLTVWEKDQAYHVKTFGAATEKAIRNYLNCLEDIKADDPLWIKLDGCALSAFGIKEVLRRLCNEAGIAPQSFHDFRRFYALELYNSTKDIYFVSRALDHKSVEVTKRYLNVDQMADLDAIRAVSPMDKTLKQTGIKVNRARAYA